MSGGGRESGGVVNCRCGGLGFAMVVMHGKGSLRRCWKSMGDAVLRFGNGSSSAGGLSWNRGGMAALRIGICGRELLWVSRFDCRQHGAGLMRTCKKKNTNN